MRNIAETSPLLAGVCSRLGRVLRCNAWALRAVFLLLLLFKTLVALFAYVALALLIRLLDRHNGTGRAAGQAFHLVSPQFASLNRRLEELDRRFRAWEESGKE
jgi:phage shock protein PspC (stress-responsive transcriptional regulator)